MSLPRPNPKRLPHSKALASPHPSPLAFASRLNYQAGVNAKRYEWFADALRAKGWTTTPLRRKGHEEYFDANGITDIDMTKLVAPLGIKNQRG